MRRKGSQPFCRKESPGGRANRHEASARQSGAFNVWIEAVAPGGRTLLRIFCEGGGVQNSGGVGLVSRSLGRSYTPDLDLVHGWSYQRNNLLERTTVFRAGAGELRFCLLDGHLEKRLGNSGTRDTLDLGWRVGCGGADEPAASLL